MASGSFPIGEPIRWQVSLTADDVRAFAHPLEALLVGQHKRWRSHMDVLHSRFFLGIVLASMRWLGMLLSLIGCGLALWASSQAHCSRPGSYLAAVLMLAFFGIFAALPRIEAALRDLGERVTRKSAHRLAGRLGEIVGATLDYALADNVLSVSIAGQTKTTELTSAGFAIVADRFACLFRGRTSLVLMRLVHLPNAEVRSRVAMAFALAGIEVVGHEGKPVYTP
jgi:hypothetical protein